MKKTVFILGAKDIEMVTIERLILAAIDEGLNAQLVTVDRDDQFKHVKSVISNYIYTEPVNVEGASNVIFVEANASLTGDKQVDSLTINHHTVDNPEFFFSPDKYWEASSVGRIWIYLKENGVNPEQVVTEKEARVIAAYDHCPFEAYRGQCPGVDVQDIISFADNAYASMLGISVSEYHERVNSVIKTISGLSKKQVNGIDVALVEDGVDILPEFLDASLRIGQPFLTVLKEKSLNRFFPKEDNHVVMLHSAPEKLFTLFTEDPEKFINMFDLKVKTKGVTHYSHQRSWAVIRSTALAA